MTIIHRLYASAGDPGDTVSITNMAVDNATLVSPAFSGVRLGSNGGLDIRQHTGSWSSVNGEWLVKGTASDFYVSRTIDSGTLTEDAGAGPLQLNATRAYSITQTGDGIKTATITLDISDDVSGIPIVASAQYVLTIEVGL